MQYSLVDEQSQLAPRISACYLAISRVPETPCPGDTVLVFTPERTEGIMIYGQRPETIQLDLLFLNAVEALGTLDHLLTLAFDGWSRCSALFGQERQSLLVRVHEAYLSWRRRLLQQQGNINRVQPAQCQAEGIVITGHDPDGGQSQIILNVEGMMLALDTLLHLMLDLEPHCSPLFCLSHHELLARVNAASWSWQRISARQSGLLSSLNGEEADMGDEESSLVSHLFARSPRSEQMEILGGVIPEAYLFLFCQHHQAQQVADAVARLAECPVRVESGQSRQLAEDFVFVIVGGDAMPLLARLRAEILIPDFVICRGQGQQKEEHSYDPI